MFDSECIYLKGDGATVFIIYDCLKCWHLNTSHKYETNLINLISPPHTIICIQFNIDQFEIDYIYDFLSLNFQVMI